MRRRPSRSTLVATAVLIALLTGCGSDGEGSGSAGPDASLGAAPRHNGGSEAAPAGAQTVYQGELDIIMRDAEGREVGTVSLLPVEGGVRVDGRFRGPTVPGYHGFHIHQNPVCEAAAPQGPFTTAGGHYNPGGTIHGEHAGDLPPLLFKKDGTAGVLVVADRFTLDELRQKGAAIIVHAQADNFAHIPDRYQADNAPSHGPDEKTSTTGDAGDRIACGVLPKN